jgi:shikimate dehydrogenase
VDAREAAQGPVQARPPVRAVLLAHPAGHSLSPAMHDAAFAATGIPGRYCAWDVEGADLPDAIARIRADAAILGANVSVPHKEAVIPALDALTPTARRLGAVNTVLKRGARLVGDNTDAAGFARALAELGALPPGAPVLVLGAGGAARAVVAALVDGEYRVGVHNRSAVRAVALVDAWRGEGDVEVVDDEALPEAVAHARLLVNTTTVGMQGGPSGSPLPGGLLPRAGCVVDLVYRPRVTPLLAAARAAGLVVQDGVPMLVHQGALAFEAWTGRRPDVAVMRRAVEAALGASAP